MSNTVEINVVMKMKTTEVTISRSFAITYDQDKFTPEFLDKFRKHFYDFATVQEHLEHLAGCISRGIVNTPDDFLEGYGKLSDFGITWKTLR